MVERLPFLRTPIVCILLSTLATVRAHSQPMDHKVTPAEFVAEFRRASTALPEAYRNVHVEGVTTLQLERTFPAQPTKKPRRTFSLSKFSFTLTDGNERLVVTGEDAEGSDEKNAKEETDTIVAKGHTVRVVVEGVKQAFIARRALPDGPYFLERSDPPGSYAVDTERYRRRVLVASYCPGHLGEFPGCVSSPNFKVREVTQVSDSGERLLKASFEYSPPDQKKRKLSGWLTVDPAMNWAVREYEIQIRNPAKTPELSTFVGTAGFTKDGETVVLATSDSMSTRGNENYTYTVKEKIEISKFRFVATPVHEFTLAAFGLGDFESPSRRSSNRVPLYATVLAIGAFAVGIILNRRAKCASGRKRQSGALAKGRGLIAGNRTK